MYGRIDKEWGWGGAMVVSGERKLLTHRRGKDKIFTVLYTHPVLEF